MSDIKTIDNRNFVTVHFKTNKDINITLDDAAAHDLEEAMDNARLYPRGEMPAEIPRFFDVVCERTHRKFYIDLSQIAYLAVGDFIDRSSTVGDAGVKTFVKPVRRPFVVEKK